MPDAIARMGGTLWPRVGAAREPPLLTTTGHRHSTQKPQSSQNTTGFLCGFREFCVDRRALGYGIDDVVRPAGGTGFGNGLRGSLPSRFAAL